MSDLVEQVRRIAKEANILGDAEWLNEAADEIERLTAERDDLLYCNDFCGKQIEQLEAKCAQRRDDLKQARDILDERFKRIEQLHDMADEIERLEARLREENRWTAGTKLQAKVEQLEGKINAAVNVGHNDDCMFCGFKDKALGAALKGDT